MAVSRYILLISALVMVWLVTGCVSSHESDMPWNTPQPWEGTIGLPGFTPSDR